MAAVRTIRIPFRGSGLVIPVVFDNAEGSSASVSRTPELLISATKLTESKNLPSEYSKFIELYGYYSEKSRYVSGNLAGSLVSSASVKANELVIIIPNGVHGPLLEERIYNGKLITQITIERIGWIEGEIKKMREMEFHDVRLISYQQNISFLTISCQFSIESLKINKFSQENGTPQGSKVGGFDFRKGKMAKPDN